ncbi:hypothetical protein RZS08_05090, partial [Arthrospira platensis SPKY1]|nr:hypothetical protein [Arthrospira platensis SPKY1]
EASYELIFNSIGNTFMMLGDVIGNALASGQGVIESLGFGLLSAMGSFLSDFGKLMIQYGTAALFFDKVKKALMTGAGTPAAAAGLIAAGIALTAIGGIVRKQAGGGLAGGGGGGGG